MCGCGGGRRRNSANQARRSANARTIRTAASRNNTPVNPPTNALNLNPTNTGKEARKNIERMRKEAIRRTFGK